MYVEGFGEGVHGEERREGGEGMLGAEERELVGMMLGVGGGGTRGED